MASDGDINVASNIETTVGMQTGDQVQGIDQAVLPVVSVVDSDADTAGEQDHADSGRDTAGQQDHDSGRDTAGQQDHGSGRDTAGQQNRGRGRVIAGQQIRGRGIRVIAGQQIHGRERAIAGQQNHGSGRDTAGQQSLGSGSDAVYKYWWRIRKVQSSPKVATIMNSHSMQMSS